VDVVVAVVVAGFHLFFFFFFFFFSSFSFLLTGAWIPSPLSAHHHGIESESIR
jgi:hypothetical protein